MVDNFETASRIRIMNILRVKQTLFPSVPREFQFRRTIRIGLRTLHILSAGTLLGGHIFSQPTDTLIPWLAAAGVTGALLLLTDLYATCAILFEARGVATIAKLIVLGLVAIFPTHTVALLITVMVIGSVSSHLPKRYRHRVLLRRQ
jgi:hypothetical protein